MSMNHRTDRDWEFFGQHDPYYGVLSSDEYRRENLSSDRRTAFFESGRRHIAAVLDSIHESIDPGFQPQRSLDFGCGVGRLLVPLAERCESVVGVDVSPAMLDEARRNCAERGLQHVELVQADDQLSNLRGQFDLIHSFIVLQHIEPVRGLQICARLIARLAPGGIGALHFPYYRRGSPLRKLVFWLRNRVPLINGLVNVALLRKPFNYPLMQMNIYNLAAVLRVIQEGGCERVALRFSDHATAHTSVLGVMVYFQRQR